ncbi:MAG: hypothetical protein LUG13_05310 [Oscillospiraceae bacterium]|nr:hypothetical protein [Oscillospiraceae bacterium]
MRKKQAKGSVIFWGAVFAAVVCIVVFLVVSNTGFGENPLPDEVLPPASEGTLIGPEPVAGPAGIEPVAGPAATDPAPHENEPAGVKEDDTVLPDAPGDPAATPLAPPVPGKEILS